MIILEKPNDRIVLTVTYNLGPSRGCVLYFSSPLPPYLPILCWIVTMIVVELAVFWMGLSCVRRSSYCWARSCLLMWSYALQIYDGDHLRRVAVDDFEIDTGQRGNFAIWRLSTVEYLEILEDIVTGGDCRGLCGVCDSSHSRDLPPVDMSIHLSLAGLLYPLDKNDSATSSPHPLQWTHVHVA